jgi:hypothetical protein
MTAGQLFAGGIRRELRSASVTPADACPCGWPTGALKAFGRIGAAPLRF